MNVTWATTVRGLASFARIISTAPPRDPLAATHCPVHTPTRSSARAAPAGAAAGGWAAGSVARPAAAARRH